MTPQQAQFVEEYLVDLNATQAAIRAGYSEKTAQEQSSRLLSNVMIAAAIQEAMDARAARTRVTADRVLQEYARIGFADIRKVAKWGEAGVDEDTGGRIDPVQLIPVEELDDDTALAVSEVSLTQTGVKVKMHDKRAALDSMAKHLGMFIDRHEHSGPQGQALAVQFIAAKPNADGPDT